MEDLTEMIGEVLQQCVDRGMKPPFIMCSVTPNGNILVMRCPGGEPEVLAEHYEGAGFGLPMTIVVADQDNEAVRITIKPGSAAVWH